MESRERDHFPRDLQPEGFLSFELSKYVYIYMQYSFFYCFNKPFHYINWKWKNLLLSYLFFLSLSGYCVSCPSECQVSVGNQIKLCDDLTDSLFWSACFFLWNPFQKIMGSKTVSDVNICLKAWQKKDYHPSTIGCRWKLESFIFCTGFCGKTVKPII